MEWTREATFNLQVKKWINILQEFVTLDLLLPSLCITSKGIDFLTWESGRCRCPQVKPTCGWCKMSFVSISPLLYQEGLDTSIPLFRLPCRLSIMEGNEVFSGLLQHHWKPTLEWAHVPSQVPSCKLKEKCHHIWSMEISL